MLWFIFSSINHNLDVYWVYEIVTAVLHLMTPLEYADYIYLYSHIIHTYFSYTYLLKVMVNSSTVENNLFGAQQILDLDENSRK